MLFCGSFLLFIFRVCHAFLYVHCSLVVTCWERSGLLALLYVMFYCVFVTFPCGVLRQVWFLIVLIPDLCLLSCRSFLTPLTCTSNLVYVWVGLFLRDGVLFLSPFVKTLMNCWFKIEAFTLGSL